MADPENSPDAFAQAMEQRRRDPKKRAMPLPEDFSGRPFGIFLLLVALLLFGLETYGTISAARSHAPTITYHVKYVFIQPLLFLMGIVYTLFGASCSKVLGPTTKPSRWGWALAGVGIISGAVYAHYVEAYLRALGYPV